MNGSMPWWESAVIYQVYPRSFQDTNDDGIGDLNGITQRLPHLLDLGVDAIWISPVFRSPMKDFGYDVSDYTDIDPIFGAMPDFERLIAEAHARGIKVILDFVPNHSSDQHAWFVESRASRNNPKRNWYIWRDPAPDGGPPNNWLSEFGGSAWEFDPPTGQYYYHAFLNSQPDLNWRNPEVVEAMREVLRFWMRKGVDGFRVDVIWHLIKDNEFRANPPNPNYRESRPPNEALIPLHTTDLPGVHDVIALLRRTTDEFADRLLIGEIYLPVERLVTYYGRDLDGVHLPFNFSLLNVRWDAKCIQALIAEYEGALPKDGWPNWVLGNHDRPRIAGRVGSRQAAVAAMLLLTLRGTPTIYYGDELAMTQVDVPRDRVRDPFERNVPGIGVGRDGCRTPMQWNSGENAGFSKVDPWLPLADDWRSNNRARLREDPLSILNLYRRLLRLRKKMPALSAGAYQPYAADEDLLAYYREFNENRLLIVLNLTDRTQALKLEDGARARILISTRADRDGERIPDAVTLVGDEGLVIDLAAG
ncbi:alpha-amylase family glycosyl hydrolase [Bradyrhizobium paxllaeri]|uniref:alpha-amylase family glycosyl hydrolase n=1 Tax=Bradyrhizobium paxllaeri TaxID=190148 RepID=UPI0008105560|nr:alpha-amylase family glycosyl hydrolase [Bradyrhizobium paxllaeri]